MSDTVSSSPLRSLTAQVVSAQVSSSFVAADALPGLIQSVYATLASAGAPPPAAEARPEPAVPVKRSVQPDYIVCLEDGARLKMLKRYLATRHDVTPPQYRERLGLVARLPDGGACPRRAQVHAGQDDRVGTQAG